MKKTIFTGVMTAALIAGFILPSFSFADTQVDGSVDTPAGNAVKQISDTDEAPAVIIKAGNADYISANSAVLPMVVTTNRVSGDVYVWFDLSKNSNFDSSSIVGYQKLYSKGQGVPVSGVAASLDAATTYYFRGVAKTDQGTTYGAALGFKTSDGSGTKIGSGSSTTGGVTTTTGQLPGIATNQAGLIGENTAVLYSTINPNGKDVEAWFEWGSTESLGAQAGYIKFDKNQANGLPWATILDKLNPGTVYYFRAVAKNENGKVVGSTLSFRTNAATVPSVPPAPVKSKSIFDIFRRETRPQNPSILTQPAGMVTENTAVLYAVINPNHQNVEAWFEWGPAENSGKENFGNKAGYIKFNKEQANGLPWAAIIDGLKANSRYVFRAWVRGESGVAFAGETVSFATAVSGGSGGGSAPGILGGGAGGAVLERNALPSVTTQPAGFVTTDTAVLYAVINPNGTNVEAWFEWGQNDRLGSQAGYIKFNKQQANGLPWAAIIGDLSPNTTYYFRAVVKNSAGTVAGRTFSFTTGTASRPSTPGTGIGSAILDFFRRIFGGAR